VLVLASLRPPEGQARTPTDVCVVIDTSGSMGAEATMMVRASSARARPIITQKLSNSPLAHSTNCAAGAGPEQAARPELGGARIFPFLSSSSSNSLLLCGGLYGELYGRPYNKVLCSLYTPARTRAGRTRRTGSRSSTSSSTR
jgi:hypothetical protein